ncbi:hypothetical protein [Tuwongella immobilis]|uniref:Uncharacterized protein n=1 Tax=Tuwongella immobilis TaxID=692036 RepID=A0A6C2YJB2_9BACT|nr:hypothetical protein [Tuwongella immobilis]VIP01660.1 unnamed protein product [Tuwongella immobilis]VTR99068.1 unnamed protein product [Tuwongella immobilis]
MQRRLVPILTILSAMIVVAGTIFLRAQPQAPVPVGDEWGIWFHGAASVSAWERFVTSARRCAADPDSPIPLQVDDSQAFLEQSTEIPQVTLGVPGMDRKFHMRWYKLRAGRSESEWLDELLQLSPPPRVIVTPAGSDRASFLANNLRQRLDDGRLSPEQAPLLVLLGATANVVSSSVTVDRQTDLTQLPSDMGRKLSDIYPDRTIRFCFTNQQMARAVSDFVFRHPELRPHLPPDPWHLLLSGAVLPALPYRMASIEWQDDPYTVDLCQQFRDYLQRDLQHSFPQRLIRADSPTAIDRFSISHSVGGFYRINPSERNQVSLMLRSGIFESGGRTLLVIPGVANPARRLLRAITAANPELASQMVAVTGDSISMNTVYRDGGYAWNVRDISMPFVFFAHHNPVEWVATPPPSHPEADNQDILTPPTGTEDVLRNSEMITVLMRSMVDSESNDFHADWTALASRLKSQHLDRFQANGDRRLDQPKYIVVVDPRQRSGLLQPRERLQLIQVFVSTADRNHPWRAVRLDPSFPPSTPSGEESPE